jgi:nicotinate-nucleotide adenylyltransferase
MGGDSLRDLPSWHRPADLVAALHYIGVMHRPFDTIDLDALDQIIPGLSIKVHYIQAPLLDISANEIRQRASQGRPFRYFLPPAIYRYIIENRLYI